MSDQADQVLADLDREDKRWTRWMAVGFVPTLAAVLWSWASDEPAADALCDLLYLTLWPVGVYAWGRSHGVRFAREMVGRTADAIKAMLPWSRGRS